MSKPGNKYELETMREIWANDNDGEHVEVGPDRDGLRCVEIRLRDKENVIIERLSFPPEMMRLIARAVADCADEIEEQDVQP